MVRPGCTITSKVSVVSPGLRTSMRCPPSSSRSCCHDAVEVVDDAGVVAVDVDLGVSGLDFQTDAADAPARGPGVDAAVAAAVPGAVVAEAVAAAVVAGPDAVVGAPGAAVVAAPSAVAVPAPRIVEVVAEARRPVVVAAPVAVAITVARRDVDRVRRTWGLAPRDGLGARRAAVDGGIADAARTGTDRADVTAAAATGAAAADRSAAANRTTTAARSTAAGPAPGAALLLGVGSGAVGNGGDGDARTRGWTSWESDPAASARLGERTDLVSPSARSDRARSARGAAACGCSAGAGGS